MCGTDEALRGLEMEAVFLQPKMGKVWDSGAASREHPQEESEAVSLQVPAWPNLGLEARSGAGVRGRLSPGPVLPRAHRRHVLGPFRQLSAGLEKNLCVKLRIQHLSQGLQP